MNLTLTYLLDTNLKLIEEHLSLINLTRLRDKIDVRSEEFKLFCLEIIESILLSHLEFKGVGFFY